MNCFNHSETPAVAYCRACGKALCDECKRAAQGTIYCDEHLPAAASAGTLPRDPVAAAGPAPAAGSIATGDVSPGLACLLGFIPGVGAIYNGQYAKGLIHAVIWGVLMSIATSNATRDMQPIFVMSIIAWWAYMVFEAYRTAQKLERGEPVDEYSSLLQLRGGRGRFPMAAVALIVLGVLLLLHTLDLVNFERIVPYWPVLLIAAGVYLLWARYSGHEAQQGEMRHER